MKWFLWSSVIAAAALAGCQGVSLPTPAVKTVAPATTIQLKAPANADQNGLYFSDDDGTLAPGDDSARFDVFFQRPPRSLPVIGLPAELDPDTGIKGWQTRERSVAALTNGGHIILILEIYDAADDELMTSLRDHTEQLFGAPSDEATNSRATYAFWDRGDDRLMLCEVVRPDGTKLIAHAVGTKESMTTLRMDVLHAREDIEAASKLAASRRTK